MAVADVACIVVLFGFAVSRMLPLVMQRQAGTVKHLQPIEPPHASGIPAVVELQRAHGLRADRTRGYVVVVDEIAAASVRPGDIVRIEVAPGKHAVRCHIDWCSSRAIELRLAEGEQATLRCRPQVAPVALLCVLFRPGRYLRLALIAH
jgi:hypothetical protein